MILVNMPGCSGKMHRSYRGEAMMELINNQVGNIAIIAVLLVRYLMVRRSTIFLGYRSGIR